ncbi:MAG: hypothetical protein DIZ80_03045 [endosymbiont of Galathealinum brachiosum]|uniref:Flagellar biosynthesis protein FlgE n=1 Tax=endosymbiont of Galathealinum brachiosum TaxID=2200906 RepID=A0A370DHV8_9GAMM|nr:MAG: hypothetical protein DIZ80_03045 [endosymbiont of Galathealinum brachiosum]
MGVLSVQSEAVQGIQRGLDGLRKNASEIASADQLNKAGQGSNLEGSLLDLEQNKVQAQASAKVVSAIDEVVGSIIDIRA